MHREKAKLICEKDKDAIAKVLAERILSTGYGGKIENLSCLIPLWKKYGLYDKFFGIRRDLVSTRIGKPRIKRKISEMDMPSYTNFSRDFIEGLIMSGGAYVGGKQVLYPSIEFTKVKKRNHIAEFLKSCKVDFVSFNGKWSKYIIRTQGIPFLLIKSKEDLEQMFIGMLAGGEPVYIDNELHISLKIACLPVLDKLGVIYEIAPCKKRRNCDRLIVSVFYLALFISDMPNLFFDYWFKLMPMAGGIKNKNANFIANIHWFFIKKHKIIKENNLLPYLLSSERSRKIGNSKKMLINFIKSKKINFIDKRILDRCNRWMSVSSMNDNAIQFSEEI